jgi:hypothetical protein
MAVYTPIDDPSAHFQVKRYNGQVGSSSYQVTFDGNSDLQPDLTWHKSRGQTYHHYIFDSGRGVDKWLQTDTEEEQDGDSGDTTHLNAYTSNGFTLNASQGISDPSAPIMCVAWKFNGGTMQDIGGNNLSVMDRQTNSTAKQGMSRHTGNAANGANGYMVHCVQGSKPDFLWGHSTSHDEEWTVGHSADSMWGSSGDYYIEMDAGARSQSNAVFYDARTTDYIKWGAANTTNNQQANISGRTYVHYMHAEVQGYSQFGQYTGNGNADGPIVYTGFKPALVMVKQTQNSTPWQIWDHKCDDNGGNPRERPWWPTVATAATVQANEKMDFLATGFKLRGNANGGNVSNGTYLYCAWAHQPTVTSGGLPCTAY